MRIFKEHWKKAKSCLYTPQGYTFTQSMAEEFAKEDNLVILCGHYEGIDERALENIVTDFVSIGDYVLTGGELPAMVVIDTVSRLVPGVLNNEESAKQKVFQMVCLSIRNTQDQQIIMGKLFQRCFYQVIMLILKSGDMKSHWRELRNTDQICMKHM